MCGESRLHGEGLPKSIRIGRNETVDGIKSDAFVDPDMLLADGEKICKLTINVKSTFGNGIEQLQTEDFNISNIGNAVIGNFQELGSGEYSFDITNETAETIVLKIEVSGVELSDQPEIEFEQAINPNYSNAEAIPDTLGADGIEQSVLTITVRDYANNPINGLAEGTFLISNIGDAVIDNFQELGSGEYSFDITNETAETLILTIEVDRIELIDQPEISFINTNTGEFNGEDFTGLSSLPENWSIDLNGESVDYTNWSVVDSSSAGGTAPELRFSWAPTSNNTFRISTYLIDASNRSDLELQFIHSINHWTWGYSYVLKVQTKTEVQSNWVDKWDITNSGNKPPTIVTVDLSDLDGQKFQIAWVFDGNSNNINYWYIDDIVLTSN